MGLLLILAILGAAVALRNGAFGERPKRVFRGALPLAFIVGGIGFVVGFVGPILWAPEANQGPLLGIFITGPLGFVLGLVIGIILQLKKDSKPAA